MHTAPGFIEPLAVAKILKEHPDCKIIFLTMSESDENLFAAIRSGAKGYLLKNMSPSKLVTTIRSPAAQTVGMPLLY